MVTIAAFYRFTPFADPAALKPAILAVATAGDVRGTLLLAREGLNGTLAGPRAGIDAVMAHLRTLPGCADLTWKESAAEVQPFNRLKVRLKREIVTMGQPQVDPRAAVGRYVAPADWNALLADPGTVVIDTRNAYESALGTFCGAEVPGTARFGDFPGWWAANAARFAGKRIAMFCTGGIRCEKSTTYLIGQGVTEVVHLQGGILKYLEEVPEAESRWDGACFVFDGRVSVGPGLTPGGHILCHACRRPHAPDATLDPAWEEGVACPACTDETSAADKARFRERQRQILLARARSDTHPGAA